jgi:hypothetical protein
MDPIRRVLALAVTLSFALGAHGQELERVQFPGFAMSLPKGTVVSSAQLASVGRHEIALEGPSLLDRLNPFNTTIEHPKVVVSWNQHSLAEDEYLELLRVSIVKSVPDPDAGLLRETGTPGRGWAAVVGFGSAPVGFGTRACERGFNVDVVVAVARDAGVQFELARRIVESVRCALTDANRMRLQAATRLPAGFARVPGQDFPTYATVDGEVLYENFTPGDLTSDREAVRTVFQGMFSAALGLDRTALQVEELAELQGSHGAVPLWRVSAPDDSAFYVTGLWCPNAGATFLPFYTSRDLIEERARSVLGTVGCPGEPTVAPPDATPLFEAACASGNEVACSLREEYEF